MEGGREREEEGMQEKRKILRAILYELCGPYKEWDNSVCADIGQSPKSVIIHRGRMQNSV